MRIAVWNTAFLGDAVLTLPLVHTLAEMFPGAKLDFWVRKGLGDFFRTQPVFSAVHEVEKRRGAILGQMRDVRADTYDLWINAHRSGRSAVLARCSGARQRIGFATGLLSRLCHTATVPWRMGGAAEIERLLDLTGPLQAQGCAGHVQHDWPDIVIPQAAARRAREFFATTASACAGAGASSSMPVIGLHPGSVWGTKRWPAAYYGELAAMAIAAGCRVVLFAGRGEEQAADDVAQASGHKGDPRLMSLAGKLDLIDLAAHLAEISCYVTNDSGPMHIAWALHTPVTALFGPTVEELGFFPRGATSTVLQVGREQLPCRPCGLHGPQTCPKGHHNCMMWIQPARVWEDVRSKVFSTAQGTAAQ